MKKAAYSLILAGLLLAAVLTVPAFAGEVTVVSNASMSGAGAMWGTAFTRANEVQIEEINKEGGLLVGGERYSIKYVKYDSKRDPGTSLENTKRAIFVDKAVAVMHHGGVSVTPTFPVLTENKVISMDISVGPQILRWPYNFNTHPSGQDEYRLSPWKAFVKNFGIKTVAEINPDHDSGYTTEIDDRWAAKKVGVNIISHQFFPDDTTDFYPILTKAIAAKPDMLVLGLGSPGHVPLFIKQARELGWKGPMGMTQGSVGSLETLVKIAGKGAENFIFTTPCHGDRSFMSKQEAEFMDYYVGRWGAPFIADTFLGYKQFALWAHGVKKANSFEPDKVAAALETGNFVVQGWKMHYVATQDSYLGKPRSLTFPFPLHTVKDGKDTLLELAIPEGVEKVQ